MCKARNRAGNSEIVHTVLYEGKAAHIAENIHGIFHHDQSHLERGKSIARGLLGGAEEPPPEEEKGKGKGGRGGRSEPSPSPAPAAYAPPPQKKVPRDARIPIHFATKLSNRVAAEGSKVRLTCYLEGADPFIRWFKDDTPVVFSPKCRQNNNNGVCILEFVSAAAADSAVYKCFARNESGETETSCKLEIYVNEGSADLAPTFTRSLKDTYHSNLNELHISCHVRGVPTPTITWKKDSVTCDPGEKYQQAEQADGTCDLIVCDVTSQDSGKYVCQAESRAGTAEIGHSVQVQARSPRNSIPSGRSSVKEPPATPNNEPAKDGDAKAQRKRPSPPPRTRERYVPPPPDPKNQLYFVAFLNDRTVSENSKTKLSCYLEGPEPNVRWFKDDNPITFSPKCRADFRDGLCTLTLTSAVKEDSGEYRLLARNQYSEVSTNCTLTVYEAIKQEVVPPIFTSSIKGAFEIRVLLMLKSFYSV